MKKVKLLLTMAVIVFVTMICCSMSAFALTDGDWEYQLLDNQITITGYTGNDADVVIPENIRGLPVTKINGRILSAATTQSLTFPKTVKEINRVIDAHPYNNIITLESVVIPEGVEVIGNNAFSQCQGLTKVHLPSTIKRIGMEAFYQCNNLSEINLPEGLEYLGQSSFVACKVSEFVVPASVTEMGGGVFEGNPKLEKLIIKAPITIIFGRYGGFATGCVSLKEVELPATLEEISYDSFSGCSSLESIVFPTNLKSISGGAFSGTALKEVILPYGFKSLGGGFTNCKNLESIYLPSTVTHVTSGATAGSDNAIIYCAKDSKAAKDCLENSISYITDDSVDTMVNIIYNGKRISFHSYGQNPEILEGRTLVPLRSIFEAMGADVEWDGATSTAIAKRGNVEVKITIGANEIYKNGKAISVDVPAMLLNSRTMVPARVIAEAFGADVDWNGNGRVVLITE